MVHRKTVLDCCAEEIDPLRKFGTVEFGGAILYAADLFSSACFAEIVTYLHEHDIVVDALHETLDVGFILDEHEALPHNVCVIRPVAKLADWFAGLAGSEADDVCVAQIFELVRITPVHYRQKRTYRRKR